MSDIKGITVALIRESMVCNGSINKGIKCNGRSSKAYFGTSYLDDLDFSILIRSPPFRGRLSVLGWMAFGMSSIMNVLVMSLFSLHGVYVVPFAILGALKQLAFHLARQLSSVIKNFRKTF